MTDHGDQLREAFETHEHLAPDPAAVYARVQVLARTYRRRRRGVQMAGGAVLGAGLLAGAISVPALLPSTADTTAIVVAPGTPSVAPATPSSVPPPSAPSQADLQRNRDAYFRAGYGYDQAVELARLWASTGDIGTVKAEAGRRLLAGETLPVPPPGAAPPPDARLEAYVAAGYDYDDAVELAKLWSFDDPSDAKAEAGRRLLDGRKLPIEPEPANVAAALEGKRVGAFFAAGYDAGDAAKLAVLWQKPDAYQAKIEGGRRLLAGETLPIRP